MPKPGFERVDAFKNLRSPSFLSFLSLPSFGNDKNDGHELEKKAGKAADPQPDIG